MQEIESDEITQETIDKFIADFETKLNAAEADKAEQAENAPSPEQFEAMMEECAAFIEALNAELDANAPTPDEFETFMKAYLSNEDDEPELLSDEGIELIQNTRDKK